MRRPLHLNKKGSVYIPIVCIFLLLFLLIAYIQFRKYFDPTDDTLAAKRITRDLGGKQGEILRAVREGERMRTYVEEAAQLARASTARDYVCGKPYLNRYMIDGNPCQETPASFATAAFTNALSRYPGKSLANTFGSPSQTTKDDGIVLTYAGEQKIPIAGGDIPGATTTAGSSAAGGTFSGAIADWPTDYPRITSIFGNRDTGIDGATINHPGIDISTNGVTGQSIHTLTDGTATFHPSNNGYDDYVRVEVGDLEWEYMHVAPAGAVPTTGAPVAVRKGDLIATSAMYSKDLTTPHLHLEIWTPKVDKATATSLWPGHVGVSGSHTPQMSYAVFGSDGRVFLDPICFFDRSFIEQKLLTSGTDWAARRAPNSLFEACDAYERDLSFSKSFGTVGAAAPSTGAIGTTDSTSAPATPTPGATSAAPTGSATTAPTGTGDPATSNNAVVRSTYERLSSATPNLLTAAQQAAKDNDLDPALLLAVITQESGGKTDAVSPTGCVGIGQFCFSTASGYASIFTKLTKCSCTGNACNNQATRQCSPQNDDRFDGVKSITASAQLMSGLVKKYAQNDQREAIALIAYNAGEGVAKQVLDRASPNPSWEQMHSILTNDPTINFGQGIDAANKRAEVTQYVDIITQQYLPAWGGATISGGSATSDVPGFYTVKLRVTIDLTKTAATVLKDLGSELAKCTDRACIHDTVIRVARESGARAQAEFLTDTNGCMPAAERAQAYFAEQVAWCKRSPDNACACPLLNTVEATYAVTPGSVQITNIGGTDVPSTAVKPMDGMSFDIGGDGASMGAIPLLSAPSDESGARLDMLSSAKLVLSLKDDSKKISYPIKSDVPIDLLWKSDANGGLAFAQGQITNANSCVLPSSLQAQAFCLTSPDGSFDPTVFYVDMRANSKPTGIVKEYEAKSTGLFGSILSIGNERNYHFFSDTLFPYARVTITGTDGIEHSQYFRIVDSTRPALPLTQGGLTSMFASGTSIAGTRVIEHLAGDITVLEPSPEYKKLYELRLSLGIGETGKLTLLDDNLRDGPSMPLDPNLSADQSGFTFATDVVQDVVTGGTTG